MALGEAFINVRADLKPFAKDLERDLKKVLAAAEKKITAESRFGENISGMLGKKIRSGVGDAMEDGLDEGSRKGRKKALTGFEKFFSALADFADDGLSAIPAKVKAGILLGVIAAAAVAAPFLGGVISAAVTTGIGLGIVAAGVVVAARFKVVQNQFVALGRSILDRLMSAAKVFIAPLLAAAEAIDNMFNRVGDSISRIFAQASNDVEPLTRALTGFVEELLPGIEEAVKQARPLIEALATSLPQLGRDLSEAFKIIAAGGPESALALRDLLYLIGQIVINVAILVRALTGLYFWMRVIAASATGDLGAAIQLLMQRENDAALATGTVTDKLDELNPALGRTKQEAEAAALAITDLLTAQLKGLDATIDYEQAIDDLAESIHEGNKVFDARDEKGRKNLRLVESAISAAARQRDQAIADAAITGRSIEEIDAKYQAEITTIEKLVGKNKDQNQSLKDLFATARNAPKEVEIQVETPGLNAALAGFRKLGEAAARAARAAINAINTANGGLGLKTATQYAMGGIVNRSTFAQIGEAGYAEAVIPDPAVMPQRAMDLSNKFGLTSMIANALGAGQTVVNVFLGTERLDERVDYRVARSNMLQAQSLTYGPRPT